MWELKFFTYVQTGSDFQSVRSCSSTGLTHPTSSPVSFGPVMSPQVSPQATVSAVPERAQSSPGNMPDVGGSSPGGASFCAGFPLPPGLPLSDPPRVTGAYGVPAYDPDFGFALRGSAVDNQIPAPPPPQPAGDAGSRDPYLQLLESQSAMSMLMMQMAREMNQRSGHQVQQQPVQQDPNQQQAAMQQPYGHQGLAPREMKMDEKWIPSMPVSPWKQWNTRGRELSGFKEWLEKFCGWLCLIQDAYGAELREAINANYHIQPCRSPEQIM